MAGPTEYNVSGSGDGYGVSGCFFGSFWTCWSHGRRYNLNPFFFLKQIIIIYYFILFYIVNEIDETVRLRIHFPILN